MFKNALVSVSDKKGLSEFLKPLVQKGLRLVSTGGTSAYLKKEGLPVIDVSEQTGFPEILDGRVKTLHPHIHMGLLAKKNNSEHQRVLQNYKIENFDLVIVNLYPFEETLIQKPNFENLVEKIDVGGPSMLRAAAKNFSSITTLCDPDDYKFVIEKNYELALKDRVHLASKVFSHLSYYDSMIAQALYLAQDYKDQDTVSMSNLMSDIDLKPSRISISGKKMQTLRYGENPQQNATWYTFPGELTGLSSSEILQGKELSYNNLLDLDAAVGLAIEYDRPSAVAVKHNNPCGVGVDDQPLLALKKALQADPVSVFGGIVALNRPIGKAEALLLQEIFLECIAAPEFTPEAREVFSKKKNLRLLQSAELFKARKKWDIKGLLGGFVIQSSDYFSEASNQWRSIGESPSKEIKSDIEFGEKVCGFLKSNSICLVKNGQSIGLGMGQVNRIDAVEQAIKRWKTHHSEVTDPVLISDAFFPFSDSVELAARHGIRWIAQPGGSLKDEEVFAKAKELGVEMVVTGVRHFRH